MDTATKSQSGWNSKGSQRKNGQRPSKILLIRLLKRFFNDLLFQTHLRMVKLKPFWKPSNSILQVLLSSNLNFVPHIFNVAKVLEGDGGAERNDCFHWTLIPPPQNLKCWVQVQELISVCQYARAYLIS